MIKEYFTKRFTSEKVMILGFGREGKSTYQVLRQYLPDITITVADSNPDIPDQFQQEFSTDGKVIFSCGDHYLHPLDQFDIVIKSPGISSKLLESHKDKPVITSQTAIFLELFRNQVIGVTGTKGKSTTVSLLYHIIQLSGQKVLLGGNIGVPPFDLFQNMTPETLVVYEMSSHQLEGINVSPHIAILLNIYQEHLDHYHTYRDYQLAKFNIAKWQTSNDFLIYGSSNPAVNDLVNEYPVLSEAFAINGLSKQGRGVSCEDGDFVVNDLKKIARINGLCIEVGLPGSHNLHNVLAASLAAYLAGVNENFIREGVGSFKGLPHRLEFAGTIRGTLFYNDSISTIPESTIAALKTFPATQTLLLGGFDRGVDYTGLCEYLIANPIEYLIFIGKAGERMLKILNATRGNKVQNSYWFNSFEEAVFKAIEVTFPGRICLLSPAAASYDMFKNFEERGKKFRQLIEAAATSVA